MIEFIRNAPFGLSVPLAIILAERGGDRPPSDAIAQEWYIDTGYQGDAFCSDIHLERVGLPPLANRVLGRKQKLWTSLNADQASIELPIRRAELWIVSNVDELADFPMRIELEPGNAVRERETTSHTAANPGPLHREPRAIIGMKAFRRIGARLELRFDERAFSLFMPKDYARPI